MGSRRTCCAETTTLQGLLFQIQQRKPQGIVVAIGTGKKDEPLTVKVGDNICMANMVAQN